VPELVVPDLVLLMPVVALLFVPLPVALLLLAAWAFFFAFLWWVVLAVLDPELMVELADGEPPLVVPWLEPPVCAAAGIASAMESRPAVIRV
jgi:hypothetical protein